MIRGTAISVAIAVAFEIASGVALADPGYQDYTDWLGWARLHVGERAGLASSWDRAGGNFDFSHYENVDNTCPNTTDTCRNAGIVTVATIQGPGVIHRFWMPHFTSNQDFMVRMYIDGETTPRIDSDSIALLNGNLAYFQPPLVDTFAGGQTSYEPIPFASSVRIVSYNHALPLNGYSPQNHYYQYTYSRYPAGTPVTSYTGTRSPDDDAARAALVTMLHNTGDHPAGNDPFATCITTLGMPINSGESLMLANLAGPGVVRRVNVRMDGASDASLQALRLRIRYDSDTTPAIDVAVGDFFGAGQQRAAYHSLPLGTDSGDGFYCYWPMPFRQAITIELFNSGSSAVQFDSAVVEYVSRPLDPYMCYLHTQVNSSVITASGPAFHPIASATGHGHYVGNLLYVHQFSDNFFILEGDEIVTVDGTDVLHGTGLEDAYNGGYYFNWAVGLPDEPEGAMPASAIRPMSGILHVSRVTGGDVRADEYRWQIGDRVPFTQSLEAKIECNYSTVGATWKSVGFWYQWPGGAIPADGDMNLDGRTDGADIAPFVAMLIGGAPADPILVAHGDFDGSGAIDGADVSGFMTALLN